MTNPSWRHEYQRALTTRDAYEKASRDVFDAYRTVASSPNRPISPTAAAADKVAEIERLTADLTVSQRSRADLQNRLDTLSTSLTSLRASSVTSAARIRALEAERTSLIRKVRDRDEELRGKAKLLENIQDEAMTLNLQLNMAEENKRRLEGENQELVERWMVAKRREAEEMNTASRFS
ncbi:MAG: hypothetical protein M1832_003444 [Thelocarpon impressellum]|nr:MAG: hypothetical protein M1832_003444 [Thelocarpon impressellum]